MKPELKPCPFCGGEAAFNSHKTTNKEIIKLNKRNVGYGVNCVECATNNIGLILGYASKEEAAQAWNRRVPAKPARVPSDDEIHKLWIEHRPKSGAIGFARALLAKYSEHPSKCSELPAQQPDPVLHAQIQALKKYQAWRTGEDARTMDEAGIVPREITSALDAVIAAAENHLRDATKMVEPVNVPSDAEIDDLWDLHEDSREFARAILEKYGTQK